MSINNFDQSSSGINLNLECFFDNSLASFYFEDTFHVLQHSAPRQNSILVYGMNYVDVSDFELSDPENYIIADSKVLLSAMLQDQGLTSYEAVRDFMYEVGTTSDTIADLILGYRCYMGGPSEIVEFLSQNFTRKFAVVESRGYSQGDYAEIIIPEVVMNQFPDQTLDTIHNHLSDEVDHLLWDAPIYCRLEINGNEFDFTQYMPDIYEYDKERMIEIFCTNTPLSLTLDQVEYTTDWLVHNLPETPDYQ